MLQLFVGSSALTRSFLPTDLAVPQLLRSSTWARLSLAMRVSLTVFPYRGLAPHQFTPMSGAHKTTRPNAGGPRQLPVRTPLAARVGQFRRWADWS